MAQFLNVCDTDNNMAWTMSLNILNDIVKGYSKQYMGHENYKLAAIIPMIIAYGADRDFACYTTAELAKEGDQWEYCIEEVEDADMKELRSNNEDLAGTVYWELSAESEKREDVISIALIASHDGVFNGIITAYWFMKAYHDDGHNNVSIQSINGEINIVDGAKYEEKTGIVQMKKAEADLTQILFGVKLSAHDLCYPCIKYAFNN